MRVPLCACRACNPRSLWLWVKALCVLLAACSMRSTSHVHAQLLAPGPCLPSSACILRCGALRPPMHSAYLSYETSVVVHRAGAEHKHPALYAREFIAVHQRQQELPGAEHSEVGHSPCGGQGHRGSTAQVHRCTWRYQTDQQVA